ncbi:MAG: DUF835 domain-containing protein [Candidatus Thermoplasmatota archaeon]|nr:DUF835 domain-containing protein [Candidatus Thermoplasmatota archaeon]
MTELVSMSKKTVPNWRKTIEQMISKDEANFAIYHLGFNQGKEAVEMDGEKTDIDELKADALLAAVPSGETKLDVNIDDTIRISPQESKIDDDHFLAGYVAGVVSGLTDESYIARIREDHYEVVKPEEKVEGGLFEGQEKKEDVELEDLEPGKSYLIPDDVGSAQKAFDIFLNASEEGMPGLCFTEKFPSKLKERYPDISSPIFWLSTANGTEEVRTIEPENFSDEMLEISKAFLERKQGIFMLHGIDLLLSHLEFDTILETLQDIQNLNSEEKGIFLLAVDLGSIGRDNSKRLEAEFEIKGAEESKEACPECDSEFISDLSSCPVCGSDLLGKDEEGVNKAERTVGEKMTSIYNLIYRAEELEIDTRKSYQLVSQARGELKVGDIGEAERLLTDAIEDIFESIVTAVEDDILEDSEDFEDLDLVEKTRSLIHGLKESEEVGEDIDDLVEEMEELERSLSEEEPETREDKEEIEEEAEEVVDIDGEIEELEDLIEEEREEGAGEISDLIDDVEDVLEKGKEKGIELTDLEEELEEIEEDISERDKEENLDRLKDLREEGKASLKFIPIVSEIEKKIEEEGDGELEEYHAKLEELKEEFESGDMEGAIKKGEELRENVDMIIKMTEAEEEEEPVVYECPNCGAEIGEDENSCDNCGVVFEEEELEENEEEEKNIENLAEEALDEAKERLATLRGTKLGLGKLKRSVRRSNQAKKEAGYQEAKDFADEALKAGDDLEEILELCNEAEIKLAESVEKGLIKDEKSHESELERYKRATNIGVYGAVKENLEDLVKELEDLEKEDEGDRNIAKEVRGMIKYMKELHADIEKSGIELQKIEQYFEEAIPKVKAEAYEDAFEILSEGKEDLLGELDSELKDKIGSLRERLDGSDIEVGEDRVRIFIDEIEKIWESGEYKTALELLSKTSELIRKLKESKSEIERRILTVSQIIEDIENVGFDVEKEKGMLSDVREMDEVDELREEIEKIKTSLTAKLNDRIRREVEEAEERFKDVPHEKVSIMLNRLTRAELGRRGDNLGKMTWCWKKYRDLFEN